MNPNEFRSRLKDLSYLAFGFALMAAGAFLWMRVVVTCERKSTGQPASCLVVQKRFFGLAPVSRWENEGVKRATHDFIEGSEEAKNEPGYQPGWLLVLDTTTKWQPVESGSQEAVRSAEMTLNRLLATSAPGTEKAQIEVWIPSLFALIVGLIPLWAGLNRTWIRFRGGDPDPPRRTRKGRRGKGPGRAAPPNAGGNRSAIKTVAGFAILAAGG